MVYSGQLTLAAASQRLSNIYGGASLNNAINPAQDLPFRQVILQATGADAFMGGDIPAGQGALVTSTVYGTAIDSTDLQGITLGPFNAGPIKLSDIWVAGAGATLRVTGISF